MTASAAHDRDALQPAVVLVADRTLSADYRVLFEGIFATMQTTSTPDWLMRRLVAPAIRTDAAGRAIAAPIGLRRVEAALLKTAGLSPGDVVVATPESLGRFLGPWTKIVAVSSSDPLGGGMSNTTTAHFAGGQLYTRLWMDRMMRSIREAKDRFKFAVVAGGAGAWQYGRDPQIAREHGIDTVFEGYFEGLGPNLFADLLAGRAAPPHVAEPGTAIEQLAPIRSRSILGAVEFSRGCGKGCRFCYAADLRMEHVPPDTILADIQTNLSAGQASVASASEDFFRYGATGSSVNFAALHGLLTRLRELPGLSFMQIDHGNISSIMQLSVEELAEIRRLLMWNSRTDYCWVNLGVESANGQLVAANSPGKILPFDPDTWEELVRGSVSRMEQAGFFPVYSLILGLPGETPDDVARTHRLVEFFATRRAVVFPIFHEPLRPAAGDPFGLANLRADHLELFAACYEINFRWVPHLYSDNQRAGGVSWIKRALVQMLGRGEIFTWRSRFKRVARGLGRCRRREGGSGAMSINEDALRLIRDYQEAVAKAVVQLLKDLGEERFLHGSPGHAYPRKGRLSNGSEYSFHGKGCLVTLCDETNVDWDFGPGGRTDGFDNWRLWRFAKQFPTRYPNFQERDAVTRALEELTEDSLICPSGAEYDHLLYLNA
jgi:radical SAM superfamily enzyme YgiQ (UPF0313 family)